MLTELGPSRITRGEVLEPAKQAAVLETFYRDGYAMLPGVLSADEVAQLREIADYHIDHPGAAGDRGYAAPVYTAMVLRCTQSLHRAFCDMLVREPFLSLGEAICGANAGFCGQNVIRSEKGTAVSKWHIDDILEFPLPEEIPRHDARMKMPVFWFSFQIALSDIESVEHGPTQLVPGSHYSGRDVPQDTENMAFEGRKPIPIFCKAGDVYLFNHQTWHRGMVNQSDRRRYLMQNQYCKAWGVYRFSAKDAICNLPAEDFRGASPRMLKLVRREDVKP